MPTAISKEHICILRSIAKAGFEYDSTKELASVGQWVLVDDEFDLGFLRFNIDIFAGESFRTLIVEIGKNGGPQFAFVSLFCFPDRDEQIADFDAAFQSVTQDLERVVGDPSSSGKYGYQHRKWLYSYCWWSLPEVELVLVQDEFDIQNGFDITLWVRSTGTPKDLPMRP